LPFSLPHNNAPAQKSIQKQLPCQKNDSELNRAVVSNAGKEECDSFSCNAAPGSWTEVLLNAQSGSFVSHIYYLNWCALSVSLMICLLILCIAISPHLFNLGVYQVLMEKTSSYDDTYTIVRWYSRLIMRMFGVIVQSMLLRKAWLLSC
jgi:hypothetical protein